jgi:hypothetical protein
VRDFDTGAQQVWESRVGVFAVLDVLVGLEGRVLLAMVPGREVMGILPRISDAVKENVIIPWQ